LKKIRFQRCNILPAAPRVRISSSLKPFAQHGLLAGKPGDPEPWLLRRQAFAPDRQNKSATAGTLPERTKSADEVAV